MPGSLPCTVQSSAISLAMLIEHILSPFFLLYFFWVLFSHSTTQARFPRMGRSDKTHVLVVHLCVMRPCCSISSYSREESE